MKQFFKTAASLALTAACVLIVRAKTNRTFLNTINYSVDGVYPCNVFIPLNISTLFTTTGTLNQIKFYTRNGSPVTLWGASSCTSKPILFK